METRSLTKEFKIKGPIMGVPRSAHQSGTLKTRDKKLIAMLRRLPPNRAEEVLKQEATLNGKSDRLEGAIFDELTIELSDLTWHQIQKLGAEKGVLKTGMDRPAIEEALRESA